MGKTKHILCLITMSHEVVGGWSILHDGRVDSFSFLFYECWWCGLGSIFLRVDESTCFEAGRFLMISSPYTIGSLKHLTRNNAGQMGCCHWKTLLDSRHWNSLVKWSSYRIYKAGCFCRHFWCEGRCVLDASNYKCGHLEWNHDRMDISMKHLLVFTCWRLFSPLYVVF